MVVGKQLCVVVLKNRALFARPDCCEEKLREAKSAVGWGHRNGRKGLAGGRQGGEISQHERASDWGAGPRSRNLTGPKPASGSHERAGVGAKQGIAQPARSTDLLDQP